MTQALYRKWRPQRWDEVVGQDHVVQTLHNAVAADRLAHAYLFAGPRGTGKTTTARLLAKAVNCLDTTLSARPCEACENCTAVNQGRFLDLIEIDAASNTSVDDVRELRDKINFSPNRGKYKIYIIDEVHMLSTAAFNALLKTLEEPPPHAIFILATTEIHKIPATVLSRCQRYEFRRIPLNEIVALLKRMAEAEGLQVEQEALELVARQATGAMRDAISLLDQLASTGNTITLEMAQAVLGTATAQVVLDIMQAIQQQDAAAALNYVHSALDGGSDPRQFAHQMVDHVRNLMLVKVGGGEQVPATNDQRAVLWQQANAFSTQDLLRLVRIFNQAVNEARTSWHPGLPLELAVVEAIQRRPEMPLEPERAAASTAGGASDAAQPPPQPRSRAKPASAAQATPAAANAGAEAGEQEPETAEGEAASQGGLTLKIVQQRWGQVLALVNANSTQTAALLRSGKLLGVKEGAVYVGLSSVLKERIEREENVRLVEETLQKVFQEDVRLRCVISTGRSGSLPADVDSEGMVAAALRDLGGEIVDV